MNPAPHIRYQAGTDALPPLPPQPLVSIIIPSYNQGAFIRQTIESCLHQSYRPLEIIVVDGASTDETVATLKSYAGVPEIQWVSEQDGGPVEAVNKGLARAQGQIGLIQSSDDLCAPGAVQAAVQAFCAHPRTALVYGDCEIIDEQGESLFIHHVGRHSLSRLFSRATYVAQSCAFFRIEVARALGGWDERFPYCPDTELWFKLALKAPARALPVILGRTRKHGAQRDRQGPRIIESYLAMARHSHYLQSLSWSLRRALRAGIAQLHYRYQPEPSRAALWRAVALWPPLLLSRSIPKHRLIPGYFRIANAFGHMRRRRLKTELGALLIDAPRLLYRLCRRRGWRFMRNRADQLIVAPDGSGVACDWAFTRTLHIADVFPRTGDWLLQQALRDWPMRRQSRPEQVDAQGCCANTAAPGNEPEVSFLIGHRGRERFPLLWSVLETIAAQQQVRFEVIVAEEDTQPFVRDQVPDWVRYVYTSTPAGVPFSKSRAMNAAARVARGPLLIAHDSDMLVPVAYAAEAHKHFLQGAEVINLKRFIFYVAESPPRHRCESVLANAKGGGSLAIAAAAFAGIGGFDEEFVGWGGEDDEFWDRCLTRRVWPYGYLPLVHVWHPPQPGKRAINGKGALTADLIERRMAIPAVERIAGLTGRPCGVSKP
jgi:glycosyltransferase involved in cell wall biosynthesis